MSENPPSSVLRTLLLSFSVLGLAPVRASEAPWPPPPNILIILADDLGFSDLGSYGGICTPLIVRWPRVIAAGALAAVWQQWAERTEVPDR